MGPLARLQRASTRLLRYGRAVAAADRSLLARRVLLLASDGVVLALSFWAAFALRLNAISPQALSDSLLLLPVLLAVGLGTLLVSGWYRSLTRTTGSHSFYSLLPRTSFIVLLLLLVSTLDRSRPATFVLVLL